MSALPNFTLEKAGVILSRCSCSLSTRRQTKCPRRLAPALPRDIRDIHAPCSDVVFCTRLHLLLSPEDLHFCGGPSAPAAGPSQPHRMRLARPRLQEGSPADHAVHPVDPDDSLVSASNRKQSCRIHPVSSLPRRRCLLLAPLWPLVTLDAFNPPSDLLCTCFL